MNELIMSSMRIVKMRTVRRIRELMQIYVENAMLALCDK